jgi:hypothetical protein
MNWIFEAYSNVYSVAMMRNKDRPMLSVPVSEDTTRRHHGRLSRRG